ncbi:DUF6605 domain-containing protein [Lentzea sp. BCCO 10_0856]|uniref:DUF6605 domain-containing protein n=1 Tax=Lentzea miocenica TaxID=3095431 RepID=A0ABU4T2L0_9PSEU|nr:N,N-dimethylformamidase beta subunit family domain-containing protein [Lentzea sp. BCCO 10_0856]MDX8032247.1 DUF6605 domain-containing protein [Lentzea sp. BCCO 10_0856]
MPIDLEQSQLRMVAGGDGHIFSVQADGRLLHYRHLGWQTGTVSWANGGVGRLINSGWHVFTTVLGAADGQLFGFAGDGTVRWYKYLAATDTWAPDGATVIGTGFDQYVQVFGGWNGEIYAVDGDGKLFWFRYVAGNGTTGPGAWANGGVGLLVKTGLKYYQQYVADQGGVIYAVKQGEELHWFKHTGGGTWANSGEPVAIGTGWTAEYQREFIAMGGSLYTVFINRSSPPARDHELNWFRLNNWQGIPLNGAPSWANNVGTLVGTGWTTCRTANLQGYAASWSASTGSSLGVKVSSTVGSFSASVQRLTGPLPSGGTTVWGPVTVPGALQLVQSGYRRSGCGWADTFTVPVGANWPSGLYAATLSGPLGMKRHLPFVVKPTAPVNQLAVLLPTFTHNAYNAWGGHSQYTWDIVPTNRYVTMRRPAENAVLSAPGRLDARWYSDLLLLRWLTANGFAYDCYQDLDLHQSASWIGQYKAVVLGTHPEYWTVTMRTRLLAYLNAGGKVIAPSGNAIYEPLDLADGDTTAVHRDPNGNRIPYENHGMPPSDVLGVSYTGAYLTFEPYEVIVDHPFLAGTGLTVGSQFGLTGYNGAASGWEMDATPLGGLSGVQIIAEGGQSGGANIVQAAKANGGWAFSTGSLTFNGALDHDPAMSKLFKNAVTAALA